MRIPRDTAVECADAGAPPSRWFRWSLMAGDAGGRQTAARQRPHQGSRTSDSHRGPPGWRNLHPAGAVRPARRRVGGVRPRDSPRVAHPPAIRWTRPRGALRFPRVVRVPLPRLARGRSSASRLSARPLDTLRMLRRDVWGRVQVGGRRIRSAASAENGSTPSGDAGRHPDGTAPRWRQAVCFQSSAARVKETDAHRTNICTMAGRSRRPVAESARLP